MNTPVIESAPVTRRALSAKGSGVARAALAGWLRSGEPRARILYVDDEPSLRRLGHLVLFREGYAVDTVADGAEAWEALKETSYHLLITDNDMPRLAGVELAARVRQAGMRLPILLMSGSPSFLDDPKWTQIDSATFLPKPFTPDVLVATVKQKLLAANLPQAEASRPVSDLIRLAQSSQPHRYGGLNE